MRRREYLAYVTASVPLAVSGCLGTQRNEDEATDAEQPRSATQTRKSETDRQELPERHNDTQQAEQEDDPADVTAEQSNEVPDAEGSWDLAFEDTFELGLLDMTTWGIGWGWGRETSTGPTTIVPDNVSITDEKLHLDGTYDEEVMAGAVNTKEKVTFGPGTYMEASIKFAHRAGFQNAFWAKPASEAWPPEIDVVEFWQENDAPEDPHTSYHFLHYPESTVPGHEASHQQRRGSHESDVDLSETFRRYGVEWQPERIVHYLDGQPIIRSTDSDVLTSMGAGAPFYLMLSMNIDNIGTADRSEPWEETMVVDWVRLWDYVPEVAENAESHYVWLRTTEGGQLATFTFRTSGGNIVLDSAENAPDYWVTQDQTGAGGSVASRTSLPGFRYDGEITAFRYNGPLEVYIDSSRVDPSSLGNTPPEE